MIIGLVAAVGFNEYEHDRRKLRTATLKALTQLLRTHYDQEMASRK